MPTYGINFRENARDAKLMERIDAPLEFGDSRSPRLRQLIWMGLAAEEILDEHGVEFDAAEDREEFVREAVREYVDKQRTVSP